jgi:hypothetical protein
LEALISFVPIPLFEVTAGDPKDFTSAMSAQDNKTVTVDTDADVKAQGVTVHDEGFSKKDEATIAVAEEHSISIWHVVRHNKTIVWWCFFFSMSAIGW